MRDKLGFSSYTDVGEGWLIFNLPEADLGCQPADKDSGRAQPSGTHSISYGLAAHFKMPGDFEVELYQPYYDKSA
jgi:hypothetical protein